MSVQSFRELDAAAESLAVAFKRAWNIAKDTAPGTVDPSLLTEPAEKVLAERFEAIRPQLDADISTRHYQRALALVAAELREPIDRFFEGVFVMVDDARVRENRLRLLRGIADTVTRIAHFHQLST